MFSETTIIVINVTCIVFLIIMLGILAAATKMKGGAGWVALIIVTTTVPVYLLNMMRDLSSPQNYLMAVYIATALNVQCIPSLWFFVRSQLDKPFRFTARDLLYLIPSIVSAGTYIIYYAPMTTVEIEANMLFMENGGEDLPTLINDLIVAAQLFIFFPLMLRHLRRRKRFLRNNYSDSDYFTIRWVYAFVTVFFGLFLVVFVAYAINPRTDIWLIPILNVIAMGYLVYSIIFHSTAAYLGRLPDTTTLSARESAAPAMSEEQMREIGDRVMEYLQSSKAYTNPELSLAMLSVSMGVSTNNISRSINGYLRKNFFDLVNEMRVAEAKRLLAELNAEYTVEGVYSDCGFSSARSFFRAFQKFEQVSPDRWRKENAFISM